MTQGRFQFTCDRAFESTIRSCAEIKRKNEDATWIDAGFVQAYDRLHQLGYAHSFEAWQDEQLVGGLYGIAIGSVFFGESMFAKKTNASKAAFIKAVGFLEENDFRLIDCQVSTDHLTRFGAEALSKKNYLLALAEWTSPGRLDGVNWNEIFLQYISR